MQRYLGQPITHTPGSLEDMYMCEQAKNAFLRGQPNPLWLDHTSSYYRPRSTRMYYWRKHQVSLYGIQWLDSPQANNPPPPTFMLHLDVGPP